MRTPLRGGKGWSLAPFFSEHKWFGGTRVRRRQRQPDMERIARHAGPLRGRRRGAPSWQRSATSTSTRPPSIGVQLSGLTSLVGYELRFPLDPGYDDQVLVVPELGYENLEVSSSDATRRGPVDRGLGAAPEGGVAAHAAAATRRWTSRSTGASRRSSRTTSSPTTRTPAGRACVALNISIAWGL